MTRIARAFGGLFLVAVSWVAVMDSADARELSVTLAPHEHEMFFELSYHPRLPAGPGRDVVLALDSSRSLAGEPFEEARAFAIALAGRLEGMGLTVRMVYGDYRTARCPGAGKKAIAACLRALEPGGATDLEALLSAAVDLAGAGGRPASVLLVSDGVPAFGERVAGALVDSIRARTRGRDIAVHTAGFGRESDRALLAELARSLAGTFTAAPDVDTAAQALRHAVITEVAVEVVRGDLVETIGSDPGNRARAEGFRLAGKLVSGRARVRVRGVYRGRRIERSIDIDPERAPRDPAVVERWAHAAIAYLSAQEPVDQERIDDIEARYLPEPEGQPMQLGRRAMSAAPRVSVSTCGWHPRGGRNRGMIHRKIRALLPGIRHCYEQRLKRDRRIAGRVSLAFTIAPDGTVREPRIQSSSLDSAPVEACVLEQVSSLAFTALDNEREWVDVHYPFELVAPPVIADRELLSTWAKQVDRHLAEGRVQHARTHYVERRLREIADNGLGDDALLGLLRSRRARLAFAPEFERAARARLARPALPMDLAADLFDYFLEHGADADLVELFGPVDVDTDTGAGMLGGLAAGPRARGEELVRAWLARRGAAAVYGMVRARDPSTDDLLYPGLVRDIAWSLAAAGDTREEVMDEMLDAARQLGRESDAVALVLQRCDKLQEPDDPCIDWLTRLQEHEAVRARLHRLFAPVIEKYLAERRESPEYSFGDFELARALMFTGRPAAAVRALSELVEQDPADEWVFREFALGLMQLRRFDEACTRIHAYASERSDMDGADYVDEVYEEAWGKPAPAGLCRVTRGPGEPGR